MAKRRYTLWARLLGIFWIVVIGIVPAALAQETKRSLRAGELQTRLERLEQELALECKLLEKTKKSCRNKSAERKVARHELARQVLDKKIELEKLKKRKDKLEKQAQTLTGEVREIESMMKKFLKSVRSSAERLDILLSEIPADDQCAAQVREMLKNLPKNAENINPKPFLQHFRVLMGVLERVHRNSTTIQLQRKKIRTDGGLFEEAMMLAVGNVAFAYETVNGGRIGVLLSSPADASGYRWTEKLADSVVYEVRQAISKWESNGSSFVSIPMDVTGRLRVDALIHKETWGEWFNAGGPVMFPLAAVAALAFFVIMERTWWLYIRNFGRSLLMQRVLAVCNEKKYAEAEGLLCKADGAVAHTLATCLRRRSHGVRAMEDGIQEQILHELPFLRRFLGGLAILAAVAPLLGLLGTVTGMIRTFNVIHAFGNANSALMAGGISEALITTEAGLAIAIPTVLLCGLLRGRMEKILGDSERYAATLLNMLSQAG